MSTVVRPATPADVTAVVGLYDRAVAWMTEQGATGQWGATPFSEVPQRVDRIALRCGSGTAWVAETDGHVAAFVCCGDAPDFVRPPDGPEVYVTALVSDRSSSAARGAGRLLLGHVDEVARQRGVPWIRVDCYAGNDGRLVRFYESAGYRRDHTFTVRDWPGQVLRRATPAR